MDRELYRQANEAVALADFSGRARWIVRGSDAVRFIHGQCTNDITGLAAGQGCYACFLSGKGKLRGDAVVYRLADRLGIETEPILNESLRLSLERFIIADDVQIEDVTGSVRQEIGR